MLLSWQSVSFSLFGDIFLLTLLSMTSFRLDLFRMDTLVGIPYLGDLKGPFEQAKL